jgi:MFS-type transporter involved in bile tolerance (Atg22 family)
MIINIALLGVIGACVWGVLDKRLPTRTMGTLALSLIAILAMVGLC